MSRLTASRLTAVCIFSTWIPSAIASSPAAHAVQMLNLFERDSTSCLNSNYTACGQGFPSNFCCLNQSAGSNATTCNAFNGGKSAICCPVGQSCVDISTIPCQLSLQDPNVRPDTTLMTTELSGTLPTCGNGECCPIGYTCNGNGCLLATTSSSASAPTSSPTSSSTSSSQTTSSPTTTPALGTQNPVPLAHYTQYPTDAVLVGFFPGLVAGILLAVIALCCFGRQRHKKELESPSPDFSSVTATVSDPIYQPEGTNAFRTDFLRRESKSKYPNRTSRVRSLFSRTPTLKSMRSREAPVDGIGRSILKVPETPVAQRSPESSLKKEPSMESIKIYSPPNGGLGRPGTTFAEMLREAGFQNEATFMGSPGRVDPRSRDVGGV